MTRRLTFDVGRSRCRAAVYDGPRRLAVTELAATGTLTDSDGVARVAAALGSAVAALGAATDGVAAGCAAVAGARGRTAEADGVAGALSRAVGMPLALTSDVVAAHAGALGGEPGVVVAAGTGAVALGVAGDGRVARVDGWGYLLGDEGSGYAVGRAGLAAALRAADGRGEPTALVDLAVARFGPLDTLPHVVAAGPAPARAVASFARDVAQAARADDAVARAVWDGAVSALLTATTAAAAPLRAGEAVAVSWTGGLFAVEDLVLRPFRAGLAAADVPLVAVSPLGDALDGAALLALDRTRPHERLVHRTAL